MLFILIAPNLILARTIERVWELLVERSLLGLPIVAILGRPNVGKSTLINRFIGRREAIVEDTPGVTRDRVQYECEWGGRRFIVMDTGGWESRPDGISVAISAGAELAMEEADILAFVVDAQVGALDEDDVMVQELRKAKKPTILIANKVDGDNDESDAHALWNLGLGEPHFVSGLHGRGSGDLLDAIVSSLPEVGRAQTQDGYRRIALIGRPNVGKSSLLNALAGENRSIVDDVAGTTRDPVDSLIEIGGQVWRFVDTAGIKKRANQASGTDYYATLRTQTALERSECVALVLDASVPISEQDLRIISMVEDSGKAMVLVLNKWDLVDEDRREQLEKELDRHLGHIEWVQRVNVAAKTGWHRDRFSGQPFVQRSLHGRSAFPHQNSTPSLERLSVQRRHRSAVESSQRFTTRPKQVLRLQSSLSSHPVGSRPHIVASLSVASAKSSVSQVRQFRLRSESRSAIRSEAVSDDPQCPYRSSWPWSSALYLARSRSKGPMAGRSSF